MNQSENINELAAALAKAQGEIVPALKDSNNPFYNSKFADLNSVWNACRQPLSDNGLAVLQVVNKIEGDLTLITTLAHSSGQWIRSFFPIELPDPKEVEINKYGKEVKRNRLHVLGGIITYLRRYALSSMVGIVADEDLDGNELNDQPSQNHSKQKPTYDKKTAAQVVEDSPELSAPIKKFITEEEGKELSKLLSQCDQKFQDEVWKFLTETAKISCYEEMNPKIYAKVKQRVLGEVNKGQEAA